MNWRPSSRGAVAALLVLALLGAAVGPVAATKVSNPDVASSGRVGDSTSATYEFTELYSEYNGWTLRGETGLNNPVWTVTTYDQTGAQLAQVEYTNGTFTHDVEAQAGVNKVSVKLSGEGPEPEEYDYRPPQQFTFARFAQVKGGSTTTLETTAVRPYTDASQEARTAISEAESAINASAANGADVSGARSSLKQAVDAYETPNFDLATELAHEARTKAQKAADSRRQSHLLLLAGGGVVVLLVVLGGVYWYLQNRQTYDKLG